jgi:hypothetical protein
LSTGAWHWFFIKAIKYAAFCVFPMYKFFLCFIRGFSPELAIRLIELIPIEM